MSAIRSQAVHPFEKLSNFRDLGGLRTVDGHTVRTGVLFRSEELSRTTRRDLAQLREFGIKLICDLRSPEESRGRRPRTTIPVVNIALQEQAIQDGIRWKTLRFLFGKTGGDRFREFMGAYYHRIAFEQTHRIRELINLLAQEGNLPALIHCNAGKDRTGLVAALIQSLTGVPYELVREEYLRTNDHFRPRLDKFIQRLRVLTMFQVPEERMRCIMMAHAEFLDEVHGRIVRNHGSVETYLREACEIKPDTLRTLKDRLLDRSATTNPGIDGRATRIEEM